MIEERETVSILEQRLRRLPPAPSDTGTLVLVVARPAVDGRHTPARCRLTPEQGVEGDRWAEREVRHPENMVTVMRADVAKLFAGDQALSLFGDNLLVDLDLSEQNLPAGTTLQIGAARCEVTPKPHTGCGKFLARFGDEALRLTADPEYLSWRLRGIHVRVVAAGDVAPGDRIQVLSRPGQAS